MKRWQRYSPIRQNVMLGKFLRRFTKKNNWHTWILAFASIVQVFVMILILSVTCRANDILEKSAETSDRIRLEIRRQQIKPEIRLKTKRVSIGNKEASGIVVTMQNIGTGAAKDIVIIVYENNIPNPNSFKNFYQMGTFPILKFNQARNIPLTKQTKPIIDRFYMKPVLPDTGYGQDFIRPAEELEFQYGCYEYGKTPVFFPLGFVITYYDVDENEYTTVTNSVPGIEVQKEYNTAYPMFDSMSILLNDVNLNQYKTYLNRQLRDSTGEFRGIPKPE
ncbi:MAG: hypothetical protein IIA17_11760 [candidate division Zixibacteria bacterium]|nr:hypothetical protein [candidate division Zixibacteria bacterium]